jgi:hypothetical protein
MLEPFWTSMTVAYEGDIVPPQHARGARAGRMVLVVDRHHVLDPAPELGDLFPRCEGDGLPPPAASAAETSVPGTAMGQVTIMASEGPRACATAGGRWPSWTTGSGRSR